MYGTICSLYRVHHLCTPSCYLDICTVQYIPCILSTILVHHPATYTYVQYNISLVSCTPSLYTIQLPRHMYSKIYPLFLAVHHPCTPSNYHDICTVQYIPCILYTIQLPINMYSTINPLYPVHHPFTPSSYLDICTIQYIPCILYTILLHHPTA